MIYVPTCYKSYGKDQKIVTKNWYSTMQLLFTEIVFILLNGFGEEAKLHRGRLFEMFCFPL